MKKKQKIFLGPVEIAGYYSKLKEAINIHSADYSAYLILPFGENKFKYGGEDIIFPQLQALMKLCKGKYSSYTSNRSKYVFGDTLKVLPYYIVFRLLIIIFVVRISFYFDIFIYSYGTFCSKHPKLELLLLRILKKKVFVAMWHGSESRLDYIDGAIDIKIKNTKDILNLVKRKKKIINLIEANKVKILANRATTQLLNNKCVDALKFGLPFGVKCLDSVDCEKIIILHAPSNEVAKGSNKIRNVIFSLKNKYDFEYVEINNTPNQIVLEKLNNCTFVVDQLYGHELGYVGPWLGGLASEAAQFGKPSVVGAYWKPYCTEEQIKQYPCAVCDPDDPEPIIERMIIDAEFRNSIAERAQKFLEERYNPKKVAECYIQLIEGTLPKEYWYNPKDCMFLHGACANEKDIKESIRSLIEYGGREALCLSDKPALEKAFVDFAYSDEDNS